MHSTSSIKKTIKHRNRDINHGCVCDDDGKTFGPLHDFDSIDPAIGNCVHIYNGHM